MDRQAVISEIADLVDVYTGLPLMFFTLGNYGKGFNVNGVVWAYEVAEFTQSVEERLGIKIEKKIEDVGTMHINQFCDLCVARVKALGK